MIRDGYLHDSAFMNVLWSCHFKALPFSRNFEVACLILGFRLELDIMLNG